MSSPKKRVTLTRVTVNIFLLLKMSHNLAVKLHVFFQICITYKY